MHQLGLIPQMAQKSKRKFVRRILGLTFIILFSYLNNHILRTTAFFLLSFTFTKLELNLLNYNNYFSEPHMFGLRKTTRQHIQPN